MAAVHHLVLATTCLTLIGWTSGQQSITFPTDGQKKTVFPKLGTDRSQYQLGLDAIQNVASMIVALSQDETAAINHRNWVLSPPGLTEILGQLLLGASGPFRRVLGEAFVFEGRSRSRLAVHRQLGSLLRTFLPSNSSFHQLSFDSVFFVQSDLPLKQVYRHALHDLYGTDTIPVDFLNKPEETSMKINTWVKEATQNKVGGLAPLSASVQAAVMLSAVYYIDSWQHPFSPELTRRGEFKVDENQVVSVMYMTGDLPVYYFNSSEHQLTLVGLPYKESGIVLYVLLPHLTNQGRHNPNLNLNTIKNIILKAQLQTVTLLMPKTKLQSSASLRETIIKFVENRKIRTRSFLEDFPEDNETETTSEEHVHPIPLKFEEDLVFDMTSASDDPRFQVDDVLQQVSLEIDENGAEIAAITSTLIDHFGGTPIVKINRPFLFFLRHMETGIDLFWGSIVNPSET